MTLSLVLSITRTLIHSLTRNSFTRISRAQHLYILTKGLGTISHRQILCRGEKANFAPQPKR